MSRLPRAALRRLSRSSLLVAGGLALTGFGLFALRSRTTSVSPLSPLVRAELNGVAVIAVLVLAAAWLLWGWKRPRLLSDVTVAALAAYVGGSLLLALRGTPWGLYALFGDQVFRTEAVTRFTETLASADYAYRGLPSHYPPLLPWLEARLAGVSDLAAWETVKYGQIALSLVVPVLAYVLWSRVVRHPVAAGTVAVTTLFAANPAKVDQWLVLAVVLPWWLDAFRDGRREGVRRWPAWVHGVIAGLLLTTFTFYFLPLTVATLLGLVVDVVRRRPWRVSLLRYAVIALVGLAVSSWYWLPLLLERLAGAQADRLQMMWFTDVTTVQVPLPLTGGWAQYNLATDSVVVPLVTAAGVALAVAAASRHAWAEGLLLVMTGSLAVIGVGLVAAALGRPFLAFKTNDLLVHAMLAAGVVGLFALVEHLGSVGAAPPSTRVALRRGLGALLAVAVLAGGLSFVETWPAGDPVEAAYEERLPDGSHVLRDAEPGASQSAGADELRAAMGAAAEPSSVVLTNDKTLLATTPFHLFVTWQSFYSNPYGRFAGRVAFLQRLAGTDDAARFADLARSNRFDAIDAFVLDRRGDTYTFRVLVDDFPQPPAPVVVRFRRAQFDERAWEIVELGDRVVVTRR